MAADKNAHNGFRFNTEYILGQTNYNGIITHSSKHMIQIIFVNAQVVFMTPGQDPS